MKGRETPENAFSSCLFRLRKPILSIFFINDMFLITRVNDSYKKCVHQRKKMISSSHHEIVAYLKEKNIINKDRVCSRERRSGNDERNVLR